LSTERLTMAQALVRFLTEQYVERDGIERRLFAGCFGIFGHGNIAGVGQALQQYAGDLPYYQARNEQAMVHAASAYARQKNRLQTLACTTSIGPGATNMVTGAALATINRLPVLLLPGDVFASRGPDPVLQQLETPHEGTLSVNDCFRPVSRYFDRISRPEQVIGAALAAMRVLTDQAETGAVTLALPQDVQAEAYDYPVAFFERRMWRVGRPIPEAEMIERAAAVVRKARRPMIVSGGGTIYSEATDALRRLAEQTGIPVAETQAGKGSMPYNHPLALGAVGSTGTLAANRTPARPTSPSGSAPAGATSRRPPCQRDARGPTPAPDLPVDGAEAQDARRRLPSRAPRSRPCSGPVRAEPHSAREGRSFASRGLRGPCLPLRRGPAGGSSSRPSSSSGSRGRRLQGRADVSALNPWPERRHRTIALHPRL
jgi:hypothetical protein